MELVLDSSVALAWVLPDETSSRADRLLEAASPKSVFVANALTMAQRRRRLVDADRARVAELYGLLPIQTDTLLNVNALWRFHALAGEYGLSAYLELTQRRDLGLTTFDRRLISAARRAGVKIVPS
ncbi:MAG TPA: type II toxin-antitoxin system VapC family toxin [bacterium]|nr:type II toxin-antitoxin system VapC family toxin [bacterium]